MTTPRLSLAVTVFLVASSLARPGMLADAGQDPGQFRASARTVPVYVTVTGSDGRLVPDLGRDDFEIYDEGVRQELTVFSNDVQPIAIVLMLDRSGSVQANFALVQQAAEAFVRELLPEDLARIGSFAQRVQVDPPEFTGDQDELVQILKTELQPAGPTPLWNAVAVGMTALLRQPARRVVLVFTDGADAPMNPRPANASLSQLIQRAREEDVMVYGVGLQGGGGRGRTRGGDPDAGLEELAGESGGGYFALRSARNLEATFARVAAELHHQYALGFTPQKLDGKVHDIEVRVTRDGMTPRSRKSYLAPRSR